MAALETLRAALASALGGRIRKESVDFAQLTLEMDSADFLDAAKRLRDDPELEFTELMDVVGVDYEGYGGWSGPRFPILYLLLSVQHHRRRRGRRCCRCRAVS